MRFMPKVYWPNSSAAESARAGTSRKRPRTILVSTSVIMLMAELLRVMGMPMAKTWRISFPPLSGTSREVLLSRCRKR